VEDIYKGQHIFQWDIALDGVDGWQTLSEACPERSLP
jgi:hypothetical protein